MHEDPFFRGADVVYDCHAGALCVEVVGDVVDGCGPGFEVRGCLVGELLAVFGVALVGVVDYDFGLVGAMITCQ